MLRGRKEKITPEMLERISARVRGSMIEVIKLKGEGRQLLMSELLAAGARCVFFYRAFDG